MTGDITPWLGGLAGIVTSIMWAASATLWGMISRSVNAPAISFAATRAVVASVLLMCIHRIFYGTFIVMTALAALLVALPFIPLLPILFLSQVLNAILLVPILIALARIGGDGRVMGILRVGRSQQWLLWASAIGLGITSAVLIGTLLLDLVP